MAVLTLGLAWGSAVVLDAAGAPLWVEVPFYVIAALGTIAWAFAVFEG